MKTAFENIEQAYLKMRTHENAGASGWWSGWQALKEAFDEYYLQQQPAMTEEQMEQEAREYANSKVLNKGNSVMYGIGNYDGYLAALRKNAAPATVEDGVLDKIFSIARSNQRMGEPFEDYTLRIKNELREYLTPKP